MALLYCFARPVYGWVMTLWGVPITEAPFFDTRGMAYILTCARQGSDVMVENPCDTYGRTLIYSPLWLQLAKLPIDYSWDYPLALATDLAFILSLVALPRAKALPAARGMLAGLLSYTTAYAVERANNDLIVFCMTAGGVACLTGRSGAIRGIGYAFVFLAGALKYYPMVLLTLAMREPIRRCLALAAMAAAAAAALIYLGRHELAEQAATLSKRMGSWNTDSFGIIDLGRGILDIIPALDAPLARLGLSASGFVSLIALVMLAQSAVHAARLVRMDAFSGSLARLSNRRRLYLLAGAMMIVGCFLAGANINYRGVFLLFALPGLLTLAAEGSAPASGIFRHGVTLVLFVMWSEFFRRAVDFATDALSLPPPLASVLRTLYWVALQLVWWRIIALFAAILITFVLESESFRPLRAWRRTPARIA